MTKPNEVENTETVHEKFNTIFEKELEESISNPLEANIKTTSPKLSQKSDKEPNTEINDDEPSHRPILKFTSHPIAMKVEDSDIKMVDLSSLLLSYRDYTIAPDGFIPNSEIRDILKRPFVDCYPAKIKKKRIEIDNTREILEEILMKYLPEDLIVEPPSQLQTVQDMAKLAESRQTRTKTVIGIEDTDDLNKDLLNDIGGDDDMDGMLQNITTKTTKSKRKKYARQITKAAMMNQMEKKVKEREEKRKYEIKSEEQRKEIEELGKQEQFEKESKESIDVDILDTLEKKLRDDNIVIQRKEREQRSVEAGSRRINTDQLFNALFKKFGEEATYIMINSARKGDENAINSIDKVIGGRQNRLFILNAVMSSPYAFPYISYNLGSEDALINAALMMDDTKFGDKYTLDFWQNKITDILGNETKMVKYMSELNWTLGCANDRLKSQTSKYIPDIILSVFKKDAEAFKYLSEIVGEENVLFFLNLIKQCNDKDIETFVLIEKRRRLDSVSSKENLDSSSKIEKKRRPIKVDIENDYFGGLSDDQKKLLPALPDDIPVAPQEFVGSIARVLQSKIKKTKEDTDKEKQKREEDDIDIDQKSIHDINIDQKSLDKKDDKDLKKKDEHRQEPEKKDAFIKPKKSYEVEDDIILEEKDIPSDLRKRTKSFHEESLEDVQKVIKASGMKKRKSKLHKDFLKSEIKQDDSKEFDLKELEKKKSFQVVGLSSRESDETIDHTEFATQVHIRMSDLLRNYYERLLTKPWWPKDLTADITNDAIIGALIKVLHNIAKASFHFDASQCIIEFKRMFPPSKITKNEIIEKLYNYFGEDSQSTRRAIENKNAQSHAFYSKRVLNDLSLLKCFDEDIDELQEEFLLKYGEMARTKSIRKSSYAQDRKTEEEHEFDPKDLIKKIMSLTETDLQPIPDAMVTQLIESLKTSNDPEEKMIISAAITELIKSQSLPEKTKEDIIAQTSILFSDLKYDLENKLISGESFQSQQVVYNRLVSSSETLGTLIKNKEAMDINLKVPSLMELRTKPDLLKIMGEPFIGEMVQQNKEKMDRVDNLKVPEETDYPGLKGKTLPSEKTDKTKRELSKIDKKTDESSRRESVEIKVGIRRKSKTIIDTSKDFKDFKELKPVISVVKLHEGVDKKDEIKIDIYKRDSLAKSIHTSDILASNKDLTEDIGSYVSIKEPSQDKSIESAQKGEIESIDINVKLSQEKQKKAEASLIGDEKVAGRGSDLTGYHPQLSVTQLTVSFDEKTGLPITDFQLDEVTGLPIGQHLGVADIEKGKLDYQSGLTETEPTRADKASIQDRKLTENLSILPISEYNEIIDEDQTIEMIDEDDSAWPITQSIKEIDSRIPSQKIQESEGLDNVSKLLIPQSFDSNVKLSVSQTKGLIRRLTSKSLRSKGRDSGAISEHEAVKDEYKNILDYNQPLNIIFDDVQRRISTNIPTSYGNTLSSVIKSLEDAGNIEGINMAEQQLISKMLTELFLTSEIDRSHVGNISKEMMQHFIEKVPMSEQTKRQIEKTFMDTLEKLTEKMIEEKEYGVEEKDDAMSRIHGLTHILKNISKENDTMNTKIDAIIERAISLGAFAADQELPDQIEKKTSLQTYKILNEPEFIPLIKSISEEEKEVKNVRLKLFKKLKDFQLTTTADLSSPEKIVEDLLIQRRRSINDTERLIRISQALFAIAQEAADDNKELMEVVASEAFSNLISDMQNILSQSLKQYEVPLALTRCTTNILLLQNLGIFGLEDFENELQKFKGKFPEEVNLSKNPLILDQLSKNTEKLNLSKNELIIDNKLNFLRNVKALKPIDTKTGIEMGLIAKSEEYEESAALELLSILYPDEDIEQSDMPVMFAVRPEQKEEIIQDYQKKGLLKDNLIEIENLVKQKKMKYDMIRSQRDSFDSLVEMARDERPHSKTDLLQKIIKSPGLTAITKIGTLLNLEVDAKTKMEQTTDVLPSKIFEVSDSTATLKKIQSKKIVPLKAPKVIQKLPPLTKKAGKGYYKSYADEGATKLHEIGGKREVFDIRRDLQEIISTKIDKSGTVTDLRTRIKNEMCKEYPFLAEIIDFDNTTVNEEDTQIIPKPVLVQTKHFQKLYGKNTTLLPFIGKSKTMIGTVLDQGLRALHFNLGPGALVRAVMAKERYDSEIAKKSESDWWNDKSKRIDYLIKKDHPQHDEPMKYLTNAQLQHCRMTNRPGCIPIHEWSKVTVPGIRQNLRPDLFGTLHKINHCPHHLLAQKHLHRHGISIVKHLERYELIEIINKSIQENAYVRIQNSLLKCLIRVLEDK